VLIYVLKYINLIMKGKRQKSKRHSNTTC
jgi:hypothetical protein